MKKRHFLILVIVLLIPIILFNSKVTAKSDLNDRQTLVSDISPQYVIQQFIKYGEYNGKQPKDKKFYFKTVYHNKHYYSGYLYNKGNYYFEGYLYLRENPFE